MTVLQTGLAKSAAAGYDIEQSLRFEDGDSPTLSRTPGSAGNRKTWTFSFWVKRTDPTVDSTLFSAAHSNTSNPFSLIQITSSSKFRFNDYLNNTTEKAGFQTNRLLRDPGSWYHIILAVDTTQVTAGNRWRVYINGIEETSFSSSTDYPIDYDSIINDAYPQAFGWYMPYNSTYNNDYLAEVHFIDGTQLTPASFGQTDAATNQWKPIEYTGAYGTNGFYLKFQDSAALGDDSSGNTNDFTPTNLAATDQMVDSPTNNFCTLNPLNVGGGSLSEGNLEWDISSSTGLLCMSSVGFDIASTTHKYYWEVVLNSGYCTIGIAPLELRGSDTTRAGSYSYYNETGYKYLGASASSYGASFTSGDIIGIAVGGGTIEFFKNNVSQGDAWTGLTGTFVPFIAEVTCNVTANFGQDSSFAGNKTAQGNQDSNSIGDFYYEPPTDYLALCTSNLSDPSIALPTDHFNTVLWSGDSSYPRSITGTGFSTDLLWFKSRNQAYDNLLLDSVRGLGAGNDKAIVSNDTYAEGIDSGNFNVSSFDSDGFTMASPSSTDVQNATGDTYVGWNWKAGGTAVSNTDGTITSSVSANADAGFSIVSWTGNGTDGATVGHGLSEQPEILIVKNRDQSWSWRVRTPQCDNDSKVLTLNLDVALITLGGGTQAWDLSSNTASVFGLGDYGDVNNSADAMLAYCFHSIPGYSKVGSYTGNGNADGTFIYTGMKPAFLLVKNIPTTARQWFIFDSVRDTYNTVVKKLYPNLASAEADADAYDFVSNGFKVRSSDSNWNTSGESYLYLAFAESPFKTSNAR